ncbi:hypothetical protein GQ600_15686 [Phytophthora cactorum]|nr:hypothetical protein GQ600_15686 [Phytophthora cactorum]
MDLLEAIQNDVLKQKEEEALNNFAMSLKMGCIQAERLNGGHGTRVTLIDSNDLADLISLKRKPYLAQVTVWDAKPKKGVFGKTNIDFQPGAVYKFCHVDGAGFFADIAEGNGEIYVVETPVKKRKVLRKLQLQSGSTRLTHRLPRQARRSITSMKHPSAWLDVPVQST